MSDSKRRNDARRRLDQPWRAWYKKPLWKRKRKRQLAAEPSCRMHRRDLGAIVPATVVDHVEPHRGDFDLFWRGELQSLCADCHDAHKQREEAAGFSLVVAADGWPIDPRHPFAEEA